MRSDNPIYKLEQDTESEEQGLNTLNRFCYNSSSEAWINKADQHQLFAEIYEDC